jgi:Uma2 family endonuclease
MSADPAAARDTEFPNLYAAVVAAYRNAPSDVNAEFIDGELFTLPRPGVPHASAAADLVIELGPPFTRGRKMRTYRREGVGHDWLVDPRVHTLEVYRLEGGRYALLDTWEGDVAVRAEPFDALELNLALLWSR